MDGPASLTDKAETELRDFARLLVRSGHLDPDAQRAELVGAIDAELPGRDSEVLARAWLAKARRDLATEQAGWPPLTDHDRLLAALAALPDVAALLGVEDHWAAKAHLDEHAVRGVVWCTPPDIWHAIDEGMLELNLWHGDTANVAPGDSLLDDVLAALAAHGLAAHFDEGRIEVTARWQRRA